MGLILGLLWGSASKQPPPPDPPTVREQRLENEVDYWKGQVYELRKLTGEY